MTPEQSQSIRVKLAHAKEQSDMAIAAIAMLDRHLRELAQQLHVLNMQMQGGK